MKTEKEWKQRTRGLPIKVNIEEEKQRMADLIEKEQKQATIFEILMAIAMILMVLAMLVVPVFIAGFVIGRWLI